jgi:hypothetical protein
MIGRKAETVRPSNQRRNNQCGSLDINRVLPAAGVRLTQRNGQSSAPASARVIQKFANALFTWSIFRWRMDLL